MNAMKIQNSRSKFLKNKNKNSQKNRMLLQLYSIGQLSSVTWIVTKMMGKTQQISSWVNLDFLPFQLFIGINLQCLPQLIKKTYKISDTLSRTPDMVSDHSTPLDRKKLQNPQIKISILQTRQTLKSLSRRDFIRTTREIILCTRYSTSIL